MAPRAIHLLLEEMKKELSLIYTSRLQGIYLFGSYARQEQDPESHLDVLIVLSDMDAYSTRAIEAAETLLENDLGEPCSSPARPDAG